MDKLDIRIANLIRKIKARRKFIAAVALVFTSVLMGAGISFAILNAQSELVTNSFAAAEKYTLTYHDNVDGEDITVPNEQVKYIVGEFDISQNEPVRQSYKFNGWNTKADGTGRDVASGSVYTTTDAHTDLYAKWKLDEYRLSYDANGGENAPATQVVQGGEESHTFNISSITSVGGVTLSHPNPNKYFAGWADMPEATVPKYGCVGEEYEGNLNGERLFNEIMLDVSSPGKTLYAVWATRYELSFDRNEALGGKGNVPDTMEVMSLEKNHTFHIPASTNENTPYREDDHYHWGWWGETPTSWYSNADGIYHFDQDIELNADAPVKTLYAFYQPAAGWQLIYDKNTTDSVSNLPNGLSGSDTSPVVVIPHISSNYPTRTNYQFLGWSNDPNATEPTYLPGDSYSINRIINYKQTLYAIWQPLHTFRIGFVYNTSGSGAIYAPTSSGGVAKATASSSHVTQETMYDIAGTRVTAYTSNYLGAGTITSRTAEPSYTWTKEYWETHPWYAERQMDEVGTYEFLGWSRYKNATEAEFLVDENGCITSDITCVCLNTNCTGGHYVVLYGIWKRNPLHTYRLVFAPNYSTDRVFNRNTGTTNFNNSGKYVYSVKKDSKGNYYKISQRSYDMYSSGPIEISNNSYTWTKEQLRADGPFAAKDETSSTKYKLKGWSYAPESSTVNIPVDDDGHITEDITIEEPTQEPDECAGTIHNLLLFPVWQPQAQHTYNLYFFADKEATFHYFDETSNTWKTGKNSNVASATDIYGVSKSDGGNTRHYGTGIVSTDTTSYTWDQDFWKKNGLYASRPDTTTTSYEFLGWAWNKGASTPDVYVDDDGFIIGSITIDEDDDVNGHCEGKEYGKTHNLVLYPVWKTTPLHQYGLIFCTDVSSSRIYYRSSNEWKYTTSNIISPGVDIDGKTLPRLNCCWRTWSPVFDGTAPETRSYTWDTDFWQANGIYATRDSTSTIRYKFLGWAWDKNASTPDFYVDDDGYITSDITLNESNIECPGQVHLDVLYAVWEPIPVHTFTVTFNRNGGNYFRWWRSSNNSWYSTSQATSCSSGEIDVADGVHSYTWDAEFWSTRGYSASRTASSTTLYQCIGWSSDPNATVPEYSLTSDGDGFIADDITVSCDDSCTGGKHSLTLYAVWKEIPKQRTFTLKYNTNGGSGAPTNDTYLETYDNGWQSGGNHTFTLKEDVPIWKRRRFVGWSTNKNDSFGVYGYPNDDNPELHTLTWNLEPEITIPYSEDGTTLYAIWYYEYELRYNANGGTGGPPFEHAYRSTASCYLKVDEEAYPVREGFRFIGWSTDPNATTPECTPKPFGDDYPDGVSMTTGTGDNEGFASKTLYAVWEPIETTEP